MSFFDLVGGNEKSVSSSPAYSYNKIMAIFNRNTGNATLQRRISRATVFMKDDQGFENKLANMDADMTYRTAGEDLSAIFMPYRTVRQIDGDNNPLACVSGLPGFASGVPVSGITDIYCSGQVHLDHMLPFYWDRGTSGYIFDRWKATSGDSLASLVSGSGYYGDSDRYRDCFDIRGVGMRLPMMGVGWGFTLQGNQAFPSGTNAHPEHFPSGTRFFKGGYTKGWEVDQSDYVAAPIDLKYDLQRNVWTCNTLPEGYGLYRVLMFIDDKNPGTPVWDNPRFTDDQFTN